MAVRVEADAVIADREVIAVVVAGERDRERVGAARA